MGGLVCAARLAAAGFDVTVIDKEAAPGGKARQIAVDGAQVDAGPTVFTLRDIFDGLFADSGRNLEDYVEISRADIIARHAWDDTAHLDLFSDPERSEEAIGDFAGAEAARGYRAMRLEAARVHATLDESFMRASKPAWPPSLVWRIGLFSFGDFSAMRPYDTLWSALGDHFADPRLRQLFGRYATYCGSSPFEAPATLSLISDVEACGVWLIKGGISAMARAIEKLASENGARFHYGTAVSRIEVERGRATGVILANGERIAADAVVCNADPAALGSGLFGEEAARAVPVLKPQNRSLSALVWLAHARTDGFPLVRHNVFFSPDYPREFADIAGGRAPADPTAYVCAHDRTDDPGDAPGGRERLQIIVNAPANGDTHNWSDEEKAQCTTAMRKSLARCGLHLEAAMPHVLTTPNDFAAFLPSTGGAIYGRASHGLAASFLRQGTRTRIRGLYCAGGSTHPGAGVPMAALSGQLAARIVSHDLASMRRSRPAATAGGMSMRSATTGDTG
jgi:1-hydroxycarotenoid 3,4-desaturase